MDYIGINYFSLQGLVWLPDSQDAVRKGIALEMLKTSLAHASVMNHATSSMIAVKISQKSTAPKKMVHTGTYVFFTLLWLLHIRLCSYQCISHAHAIHHFGRDRWSGYPFSAKI